MMLFELATTARPQMLHMNLPLWRFALSVVVLDDMSVVLFVYCTLLRELTMRSWTAEID
jgi:hypothetical protein